MDLGPVYGESGEKRGNREAESRGRSRLRNGKNWGKMYLQCQIMSRLESS